MPFLSSCCSLVVASCFQSLYSSIRSCNLGGILLSHVATSLHSLTFGCQGHGCPSEQAQLCMCYITLAMKHLLKFWGFFRTGSKEHHKDNEPVFYGTSHVTTHNIHSSSASGQIKCAIVINIWFLEEIHLVSEHTDAPEELRLQSAPLEVKKTVCQLPRFFSLPFRLPPLIIIFISIAPNQSS